MNTFDIPVNLKAYFSKANHLKLLATLHIRDTEDISTPDWGIFFSVKKAVNGDPDFTGQVNSPAPGILKWKPVKSLWVVPLNKFANDNYDKLSASSIRIWNEKSNNGDWSGYRFEEATGTEGLEIALNANTTAYLNSAFGLWHKLQYSGEEAWNVWITTNVFELNDKIIRFDLPDTKIIERDGRYPAMDLSFGVRNTDSGVGPYISIDLANSEDNGEDCPVTWLKNEMRLDDVSHKLSQTFEAENFTLNCLRTNGADYNIRSLAITNNLDTINSYELLPWMIKEGKSLSTIYVKAFFYFNDVNVKVIQVNRKKNTQIYTRLLEPLLFLTKGTKTIQDVRSGIESTQAANPIGIVASSLGLTTTKTPRAYVAEWKIDQANSCTSLGNNVDLVKTIAFDTTGNFIDDRDKTGGAKIAIRSKLEFPLLKTTSGKQVSLNNAGIQTYLEHSQINDNGTIIRCVLYDYDFPEDFTIIDGPFEFTLGKKAGHVIDPASLTKKKFGQIRFTLQNKKNQTPFFIWQWHAGLKAEDIAYNYSIEDFSLAVKSVKAAGQDLLNTERSLAASSLGSIVEGAGERNEPALIIPIANTNKFDNYFLTFSESVNLGQDYRLDAKIQEFSPDAERDHSSTIKAVILATHPQFTGLLDARFLQQPGYDDGTWILARRSPLSLENGSWEILDDNANTKGFKLILPSQAIGEAYTKNDMTADAEMIKGEPSEDVPAEFRFGAPAILRVAHEKLDRRYVSLPQNLHHIWGQPGSEQPGVPLLESQFEMLYGLTGNLNPEGTNIAELASKLGEIPVPAANSLFWNPTVEQVATFSKDWNRYLQFYRAWKSRIAILEPSGDNAFGNARFTQNLKYMPRIGFRIKNLPVSELEKLNVRFSTATDAILKEISDSAKRLIELRRTPGPAQKDEYQQNEALRQLLASHADTADLARELLRYERIGASLKYPLSTKEDAVVEYDDIKPEDLSDPEMRMKLAHDPDGLAGGFHYGFESKAIYKEFWRETFKGGSSSAELQAPAFSSVGAWGKQTARFAGDKTVIKSTTGMGRAHFYAVERIGRIGVLWHKAKHVIEYERTVVPSPYFLEQPKLLGRPVVRKVREYIEILEPLKRYPDFDEQSDEAPGCIKSCQFKSVIIPVRSGWGRDVSLKIGGEVKEFGWEIQLWHPDADPKLFPKPQVVFELMPPADSNLASLTVSLSEPENLRFYTDTRALVDIGGKEPIELTADTTKWPAVKYVDYTDHQLPREKHLSPALDPSSGKGMELIMPDVLDVSPGFERYTLRIDSSELPAGVANRYNSKSGISGKLKAVMMMRTPVGAKPAPGNVLTDLLADSPGSLINDIYNGKFSEIKDINTVKEEISNFFAQQVNGTSLSKKIKEMGSTPAYNFGLFLEIYESGDQKLKNPTTKFLWKQAVESASGLLNRTRATYLEQANIFRKEAAELIKQGGNYKDNVLVALNKYKERLTQIPFAIDYGIESFKEIHTKLQFAVSKYESRLREPFEKADQAIKKEFEDLKKLIDDLGSDVDAAKTRAKNITKSISDQSDNAVNKLKEIKLPGELQLLNDTLINEIQKIKDLSDKLTTEIDQQTQIDTLRLKLEDYTTHFNSTADAYKADFNELIDAIVSFETAQYQAIDAELKSIRSKVEAVEVEIKLQVEVFIKRFENEWNSNVALTKEKIEEVISSVDKELFGDTNQPHGQITKLFEGILYDDNLPSPLVPVTVHKILLAIDERLEIIRKEIKDVLFGDILDNAAKFENSADVERWLQSFDAYTALNDALGANAPTKEILEKSTELANRLNQEFGKLTGQISEKIRLADQASSSLDGVINSGKQVLFNYRTVWNEFTAPGMGLNRKTVSMLVNINPKEIQERLSITPCISRVKQFGNDLDALGLRLPVTNVFEGLLPPKPEWVENIEDYGKSLMNKFNFSDVLSDIGAMRLDKLFPNFKMPNDLRDKIKVTQGFDKQNLYAWVNAEIDFQLGAPQSILNIGPINVKLNKGKFTAKFRMQMDREGNTKKESSGLLAGDWETNIANTPIMIFKDAKAIFENDRMSFDLDPSRMEMPGLLKVLTDASKTIPPQGGAGESDEESGGEGGGSFSMGLLEVKGEEINAALTGRSIPIGVQARLDIGPMNVGGGTTAMTNLSFGGHFLLQFWDTQLRKFGFMTGLGFYLGKQEAPFNFTAFILGGGGYVNSAIVFKPEEGLAVNFVMSVHASVGFAITLGWMNGSVLICMGFEGEYNKLPSTESRIYITIFIQIIGQVDILGLVNVYLGLRLAATYTGAQLVGTGRVKLTIKVCWCLTVSVNKDYQKVFAGDQDNKREIQGKSAIQVAQKISNTLS